MVSPQKVKSNLSFGPSAGNPKSRKMKVWGQVSAGCGKNVADPKPNTTENEAMNSQLRNCSDRACVCTVPILRALPNEQRPRGDVTVFVSAMDVLARCNDRCVVSCVFQLLSIPPLNSGNQESRSVRQGCTSAAAPSQQTQPSTFGGQKNTPKRHETKSSVPLFVPAQAVSPYCTSEKFHLRLQGKHNQIQFFLPQNTPTFHMKTFLWLCLVRLH